MSAVHVPVMRERVLALLAPAISAPDAILVDATLGLGGHAEQALTQFPQLQLVGLDRDTDALDHSRTRLAPYGDRVHLVHAVYDELPEVLAELGFASVQGVLFDLGVSSLQLDERDRGFSYSQDAPLDMRMDQSQGITAADVVNTYSAPALARILREYGDEKFAMRIARRIVAARDEAPFTTSSRLVDLVREAIPAATRRTGGNPAKRTFQALRIEVNGELDALRAAIPAAIEALAVGGRIVVMSYQSLEDRFVKQVLAEQTQATVPHGVPVIPEAHQAKLRLLTRGAEKPTEQELVDNPRSASVRVRAAERVAA
ncbi:MAG: 16S rRNA (cytosine(1402)-N(4))-methyltransferase RsmH [Candidatus Nanopelagicales bacterium]|nr:16S rRNA (cytosine(1402)-N(4))-methyltransferase RsmH [Candidatus Nanopelagicales bacterium]